MVVLSTSTTSKVLLSMKTTFSRAVLLFLTTSSPLVSNLVTTSLTVTCQVVMNMLVTSLFKLNQFSKTLQSWSRFVNRVKRTGKNLSMLRLVTLLSIRFTTRTSTLPKLRTSWSKTLFQPTWNMLKVLLNFTAQISVMVLLTTKIVYWPTVLILVITTSVVTVSSASSLRLLIRI